VEALADLALHGAAAPATVAAGESLTYTLTVQNLGPSTARNVLVTDALPAAGDGAGDRGPGGTCKRRAHRATRSCRPPAPSTPGAGRDRNHDDRGPGGPDASALSPDSARVSSATLDLDNSNDLVWLATTVVAKADLAVAKLDHPDPVLAGTPLTYEITVTNHGPSVARAVTLTDVLPAGVSFARAVFRARQAAPGELERATRTPSPAELGDLAPGTYASVYLETAVSRRCRPGP